MTEKFKIIGLSAPMSFTFRNSNGCWWATSGIPRDRYKALFDYCKTDSSFPDMTGIVEFDGKADDGTPMNGKVTSVEFNEQ